MASSVLERRAVWWPTDRKKRRWWLKISTTVLVGLVIGWVWWAIANVPGGDDNGSILAQVRRASDIGNAGFVITQKSPAAATYVISCDGGRGWTPITSRTVFFDSVSVNEVTQLLGVHFKHDGWVLSSSRSADSVASWRMYTTSAVTSEALLGGTGPTYVLTISAQPPGPVAPGCG